jgi:Uncharacterized conserved protein
MKRITAAAAPCGEPGKPYVLFPFYSCGRPLEHSAPVWGMTLRAAGSMRFRWSETNGTRMRVLADLAARGTERALSPVQLELIHSRTVCDVSSFSDTFGLQGDGMITVQKNLLPVVTVADCMPLYLFDPVTGVFGAVHSGWKGTGIIGQAVRLASERYGADPATVCIAVGPHIRDCCYVVDSERADYFRRTFCEDCVTPYEPGTDDQSVLNWNRNGGILFRLSLEKANMAVLARAGIRDENIVAADDCTSCCSAFGSFRRETAGIAESEKWRSFTVQAAFCGYVSL